MAKAVKEKDAASQAFYDSPERLMIAIDIRKLKKRCTFCTDEAGLEVGIMIPKNKKARLFMQLCEKHRNEFEATLRHFRKWSVRGGKLA